VLPSSDPLRPEEVIDTPGIDAVGNPLVTSQGPIRPEPKLIAAKRPESLAASDFAEEDRAPSHAAVSSESDDGVRIGLGKP